MRRDVAALIASVLAGGCIDFDARPPSPDARRPDSSIVRDATLPVDGAIDGPNDAPSTEQ
jgi:hypothetical protein